MQSWMVEFDVLMVAVSWYRDTRLLAGLDKCGTSFYFDLLSINRELDHIRSPPRRGGKASIEGYP